MERTPHPSILIVDDMPVNLQVLGALLKEENYFIAVATNGPQALALANEGGFDLILLDIEMPGMSGLDVCRKLKVSDATRDIPVIFITARNETGDIVAGFESGAVDYITKPFNRSELLARVKTHLELKLSREEIGRAYGELRKKDAIISADLRRAKEIQQSVIDFKREDLSEIDVGVHFRPTIEVGGDIFDIYALGGGRYRLFLADATGHGVQAALVTMLIKGEYDKIRAVKDSPSEILEELNHSFYNRYYRLSVLFTACVADIDLYDDRVTMANAGHPPPYVLSSGAPVQCRAHGPMLGVRESITYKQARLPFRRGDSLVLYSDGLYEDLFQQLGSMNMGPMEDIFARHSAEAPDVFVDGVVGDILAGMTGDFTDDVTLILARRP